jgi:hypothetical protein
MFRVASCPQLAVGLARALCWASWILFRSSGFLMAFSLKEAPKRECSREATPRGRPPQGSHRLLLATVSTTKARGLGHPRVRVGGDPTRAEIQRRGSWGPPGHWPSAGSLGGLSSYCASCWYHERLMLSEAPSPPPCSSPAL